MFSGFVGDYSSLWIAAGCGVLGLLFVWMTSRAVMKNDPGDQKVRTISRKIQKGAMTFLKREYSWILVFVLTLAVIIFFTIAKATAFAFIIGAGCSILAGYIGMRVATSANGRTATAASKSISKALGVAFQGGAVMGVSVVGLGLLGLALVYILLISMGLKEMLLFASIEKATSLIIGFSMGASSVALFGRVGGGIYTKAADVGADLVGKVEAGIPEDDPRNPAVIADNVGDNVGDVAGMGADLYESYVGAIISAMVIAVAANNTQGIMLAFLIAGWGIIASIIGVFFVKAGRAQPQKALRNGMIVSSVGLLAGTFLLARYWYPTFDPFWSVLVGLAAGIIVGYTAEYYTSGKKVQQIAEASKTGPATNIISGMAIGMMSTAIPLVAISAAIVIAYSVSGVFGVSLAAIGMLSITGMTVAVDAYGPIADNAAGIAEMAEMGQDVRERAEALDAVGNTTAAVGKGFAIGSAALTAMALFVAFAETANISVIDILKPSVVAGMFIGGVVPFVFAAATMSAVGKAAYRVVEEVRRQFKEITGLMEGNAEPDSERCVDITTRGALREMVLPGVLAILIPILVGSLLGLTALGGFLAGSLISGVPLAIFLANSGGAWDNAKKWVEEGNLGGKNSDVHKATVIGDTVGDPFKDTSGPSLNILLKLMAVVSLVFAGAIGSIHFYLAGLF
ncbi:MAG: sodium-translocating pyrophosphatase [Elusimicrobia bacterium]|jgi:K(+)-stimulated pyrophosphate-energized sodium pump|nr:sodium-translocating pyrophosphatase [Elusimicrobiota bacterium]